MKVSVALISLLALYVAAAPAGKKGGSKQGGSSSGGKKDKGRIVHADVDPEVAPDIADNTRDWAQDHGGYHEAAYEDLNDPQTAAQNRKSAYAGYDAEHGGHDQSVEEYPPASAKQSGQDVYTKEVGIDQQHHQGGRFGHATAQAGPGDTISYGVEGEDAPSGSTENTDGGYNLRSKDKKGKGKGKGKKNKGDRDN